MARRGPKVKTARSSGKPAAPSAWRPPAHLSDGAGRAWVHVVALIEAAGNLGRTDPVLVEAYAVNVALLRRAAESIEADGVTFVNGNSGAISANPACAVLNAASMRVKAIVSDLGLCPASSKFAAETNASQSQADDTWGDLIGVAG